MFKRPTTPLGWIGAGCLTLIALSCICSVLFYLLMGVGLITAWTQGGEMIQATIEAGEANVVTFATTEPIDPTGLAGVGERQEAGGVGLTVLSVERVADLPNDVAPVGEEFLIATVLIENNSNDSVSTGSLPFELTDSDGTSFFKASLDDTRELEFGFLEIGGEAEGDLGFFVPVDASGLVLSYRPLEFARDNIEPLRVALESGSSTAAATTPTPSPTEEPAEEPADAPAEEPADAPAEEPAPPAEEPAPPAEEPAPPAEEPAPPAEEPAPPAEEPAPPAEEPAPPAEEPAPPAEEPPPPAPLAVVATPAPGTQVATVVGFGGNIRSEPRVAPDTVLGLVCTDDQVEFLEEQGGWYRVRVYATATDCPGNRVAVGTEGWVSRELLSDLAQVGEGGQTVLPPTPTPVPAPTLAPPQPPASGQEVGTVTNGGNFRSAPQIADDNVLGQVCPGDRFDVLEQQTSGAIQWYRIRMTELAADCDPQRVQIDAEGWVSSALLSLP